MQPLNLGRGRRTALFAFFWWALVNVTDTLRVLQGSGVFGVYQNMSEDLLVKLNQKQVKRKITWLLPHGEDLHKYTVPPSTQRDYKMCLHLQHPHPVNICLHTVLTLQSVLVAHTPYLQQNTFCFGQGWNCAQSGDSAVTSRRICLSILNCEFLSIATSQMPQDWS